MPKRSAMGRIQAASQRQGRCLLHSSSTARHSLHSTTVVVCSPCFQLEWMLMHQVCCLVRCRRPMRPLYNLCDLNCALRCCCAAFACRLIRSAHPTSKGPKPHAAASGSQLSGLMRPPLPRQPPSMHQSAAGPSGSSSSGMSAPWALDPQPQQQLQQRFSFTQQQQFGSQSNAPMQPQQKHQRSTGPDGGPSPPPPPAAGPPPSSIAAQLMPGPFPRVHRMLPGPAGKLQALQAAGRLESATPEALGLSSTGADEVGWAGVLLGSEWVGRIE